MAESQDMLALRAKQEAYKKRMMEAGLRAKQDAFKGQMRAAAPEKPFVSPLANQGRPDFVSNQAGTTARPNQSFSREVATVAGQNAKTVPGTGVAPVRPTVQSTVRPDPGTMYSNSSGATLQGAQPSSNTGLRTVGQPQFSGNVYEGQFTRPTPQGLPAPAQQARSTPSPDPDYQKLAAEKTEAAQSKQGPANARAADAAEELKRSGQRTATQAELDTPEARAKRGYTPEVAAAAKAGTPTPGVKPSKLRTVGSAAGKGLGILGAGLEGKRVYDDVQAADSTAGQVEAVAAGGARLGSAATGAKLAMAAVPKHKAVQAVAGLAGGVGGYMAGEKLTGLRQGAQLGEVWEAATGDGSKDAYSNEQYRAQELEAAGLPSDYNEDIPIIGADDRPLNTAELDAGLYSKKAPLRADAATAKQGIPAEAQAGTDAENEDPSTTPEAQVNKYDVLGNEGLRRKDLNAKTYKEGDQVNFGSFGGVTDGGITGTADANGRMNSFTGRGLQQPQQGGLGGMFGSQSPYASSGNPGGVSDAELAIGRFGRANAIRQQTLDEEAQRSGGGRMTVVADPNYKPSLSEMYANKLQASRDKAFGVAQMQADATRDAARIRADGAERAGLARAGGGKQADPYKQYSNMIDAQRKEAEYEEFIAGRPEREREAMRTGTASELKNAKETFEHTAGVVDRQMAAMGFKGEVPADFRNGIIGSLESKEGIPVGRDAKGKVQYRRLNELDPGSTDYANAVTSAVHVQAGKQALSNILAKYGQRAGIVNEPNFMDRITVGKGTNDGVWWWSPGTHGPLDKIYNNLIGDPTSMIRIKGAGHNGANIDISFPEFMKEAQASGMPMSKFMEMLGQKM